MLNIPPTTADELKFGDLLTAREDGKDIFLIRNVGYENAAKIFNAILAAKIRQQTALVQTTKRNKPTPMTLSEFIDAIGEITPVSEMLNTDELWTAGKPGIDVRIDALEARIRQLELRSASDE